MRKLLLVTLGLLFGAALPLWAAPDPVIRESVAVCDPGAPTHCAKPDSSGNTPVTGSFSATVGGFRPTAFGTPVSASSVSSTQTLPAGAQVTATNTSTSVGVYCALGATATTSSQYIPPNSWFGFAISGDTQISCITASSTATVNTAGGSGLPTGANGGSGKVGIDQTIPGATNGVGIEQIGSTTVAAGNGVTGAGSQRVTIASDNSAVSGLGIGATGAAVPANAVLQGVNVGGNTTALVGDPCQANAHTWKPISINAASTTVIVSGTSSKKTYICSMMLFSAGTTNVGIVEGSGSTCGTSTLGLIGGATAATGPNLTAQAGFVAGSGPAAIAATTVNANDICLINSLAIQVSGYIVTAVQ